MTGDVTQLLDSVNQGAEGAYEELLDLVHGELSKIAAARMREERSGHTLQTMELVNEAYLRLVRGKPSWQSRAHFFGAAAQAMRRVLVEHARKRSAAKRGGGWEAVTFQDLAISAEEPGVNLLALDDALSALQLEEPRLSQVVHLRYFAGLSIEQTAEILDISPATVKRDWTYARAWLYEQMTD